MANIVSKRYQSLSPSQPSTQNKDPTTVMCVYHTYISSAWRNVTISWCKNVMNYSLTISMDSASNGAVFSSKIDLKPWNIWAKKGYKSFDFDGNKLEIYWDLKSAKFAAGSPEPSSDFYIALISKSEVILLIGDQKKKAYKRTKSRPSLTEAILSHKKENVFGKKSFSTRANFDHSEKRAHDIVVESSTTGPREPEMWISIDGIVTVHVENLHWKFRGNQIVLVDEKPVQVYWDVYGWLFCETGSNLGLFIFKSGEPDGGESDDNDSQCSGDSNYYSVKSCKGSSSQLSHFLYAWKI